MKDDVRSKRFLFRIRRIYLQGVLAFETPKQVPV